MNQTIQNGIISLENLFAVNTFRIPQYQRAYSWEVEPHLEEFLEDLRLQVNTQKKSPEKNYFLGTLLLHEQEISQDHRELNIVDGQQRMTTSVIFIATALALQKTGKITFCTEKPKLLRRNFIRDDDTGFQKLHTIQEDEPFFQTMVLKTVPGSCSKTSPSARRLEVAINYFETQVKSAEWESLLKVLRTAKLMVYAVTSAEDATQIFELQNDRGKSLTNLEALKSYLMHCIYLYSPKRADDQLAAIQTQFASIYRIIENLSTLDNTPDENQLLSYHCAAHLQWTNGEYYNPKQHVKSTIKAMKSELVVPWVLNFVNALVESFKAVEDIFKKRDTLQEFSELLLINRMAPFWPLILKTWVADITSAKKNFLKVCRLMEVFAFRGYAIANARSDTGLSTLHAKARDFGKDSREGIGEAFATLSQSIANLSLEYNFGERFKAGLDNSYFYDAEGRDALYLFWRYENHLRDQPGKVQPFLSWRDFVEHRSHAAKLSVEHVAARGNPLSETIVEWNEGEPKPFHEVVLNRLGNLVIDSISPNSAKGKKDFTDKLKFIAENSIYLSQRELIKFVRDEESPVWDVNSIRARHFHMIEFAIKTWDPATWHKKTERCNA